MRTRLSPYKSDVSPGAKGGRSPIDLVFRMRNSLIAAAPCKGRGGLQRPDPGGPAWQGARTRPSRSVLNLFKDAEDRSSRRRSALPVLFFQRGQGGVSQSVPSIWVLQGIELVEGVPQAGSTKEGNSELIRFAVLTSPLIEQVAEDV